MSNQIYTATGCARCKITKKFLQENQIEYEEFDFKAEGKDAFAQFYRSNRNSIYRDKDGVEFPVFFDGKEIRQGVSVILGYLKAGDSLTGFIGRNTLHGEWIDGFDISGGDPTQVDKLVEVLDYLKTANLKIQATTNGLNATVLETLTSKNLLDRVIMKVAGPLNLYGQLIGENISEEELKQSIQLTASQPDYEYRTTIIPLRRDSENMEYLTPEEIGETAKLIESATSSKKHRYTLIPFDTVASEDEIYKPLEPLPSNDLFKYRTAARRFQVLADIAK